MSLAIPSLAQTCRDYAQQLADGIKVVGFSEIRVTIGSPGTVAPDDGAEKQSLNLFFFRFETSGFDGAVLPGEPWLLRMHCLVTPFSIVEDDKVSSGENDLRILGEALRHFHEHPVIELTVEGQSYLIQTIYLNLGLEQINQLWSTQGDTVYRPSALIEVSLAPVLPRVAAIEAPRVGSLGLDVRAVHEQPADFRAGLLISTPLVRPAYPAISQEAWAPSLCLVVAGQCLQALTLNTDDFPVNPFVAKVWVAGDPGASVQLRWEIWDSANGWVAQAPAPAFALQHRFIDPDHTPNPALPNITLPGHPYQAGQAVLYAERSYTRAADGVVLTVRSNPVLVTLHEGA
ncbi:Pvc16 family protein [Chitinimonas naiadis]